MDGGNEAKPALKKREDTPAVTALRALVDPAKHATAGVWITKDELDGKGSGPTAKFLKEHLAAVRQPTYVIDPDTNKPKLSGSHATGLEGLNVLANTFGPSQVRKVQIDVDVVAERLAKSRKPNKEDIVLGAVAEHGVRQAAYVDRQAQRQAERPKGKTRAGAGAER